MSLGSLGSMRRRLTCKTKPQNASTAYLRTADHTASDKSGVENGVEPAGVAAQSSCMLLALHGGREHSVCQAGTAETNVDMHLQFFRKQLTQPTRVTGKRTDRADVEAALGRLVRRRVA